MRTTRLEGVDVALAHPDELPMEWTGRQELIDQLLAAWLVVDARDLPLNPRLVGKPGVGKTTLAYAAAMLEGGVAILDEGNRMSEKSWASLAPLLDARRTIESIVAGIKVKAHPDFRFVTTMNDDASTFELPEYVNSRLTPTIAVDFPDEDEEYA